MRLYVRFLSSKLLLFCAVCHLFPSHNTIAGVRVTAVSGQPFGVCEVSFPVPTDNAESWQCRATGVSSDSDRVIFPIMEHPGLFRRLSSQLEGNLPEAPSRSSVCFLFTGNTPFDIEISATGESVTVVPEKHRPAKHARLSRKWWKHIWGPLGDRLRDNGRPRPVESYIAGLGLWRLGVKRNPAERRTTAGQLDEIVIGTSRLRADMLRTVAFDRLPIQEASIPLPDPIRWTTTKASPLSRPTIEPIAHRVPSNCFYVRFGKYTNLLWGTRLLEKHGEELSRLITLRGFRGKASAKVQQQLAIQELPFAELIGNQLITDVALVGRDIFLIDGPAFGVVLQSKSKLLASGLANIRRDTAKKWKDLGATIDTVTIDGHEVSLLSTPGFELRSFHVYDDGYHFISNSKAMIRQLLATSPSRKSQKTIADVTEFQYLRWLMPPEEQDTVFAYVSTDFMKSLTTPAYIIELMRRIRARAELHITEVAVRADAAVRKAEGAVGAPPMSLSADIVERLKAREMLPPNFAIRPDGTKPIWSNGRAIDSLRGAVGTFLPIADIPVTSMTPRENDIWAQFANHHVGQWAAIDPVAVRIRRKKSKDRPQSELLEIDARIAPLQQSNTTILMGLLGESRARRFEPAPDALISAEAIVNKNWTANRTDAHVRITIAEGPDVEPVFSTRLLELLALLKRLPITTEVQPAESAFDRRWWRRDPTDPHNEYLYGPIGLVGRKLDNYGAYAFDQALLRDLPPNIQTETTKYPGQFWLKVNELNDCSLTNAVKGIAAVRATQGSLRNAQVFHQWTSLLGLPIEEGAELTKTLVGMTPTCPLDGEYELSDDAGCRHWRSTAWKEDLTHLSDIGDYSPALLKWFHGLDARVHVSGQSLELHADLLVEFEDEDEENRVENTKPKKKSLFDQLPFSGGIFSGKKSNDN